MERLSRQILITALSVVISCPVFGARVVHDRKTTEAVAANAAYEELTEESHNAILTSQKKKKQKLAEMAGKMELIKEAYRMSMQNIQGFGEESAIYRQIVDECIAFPKNFASATKLIMKNPAINYINSIETLSDIQLDMIQLVDKFVNIVNNGKIENPLKKHAPDMANAAPGSFGNKGDGYNMMDRYQRVGLACQLLSQIEDINNRLYIITLTCEYYGGLSNFFFNIDPYTWCNVMGSRNIVEGVIDDWNREMSRKI